MVMPVRAESRTEVRSRAVLVVSVASSPSPLWEVLVRLAGSGSFKFVLARHLWASSSKAGLVALG